MLCLLLSSDVRARSIGARFYLPHPYGIVIHARTVIGSNCTVFQNVTLGEDGVRAGVPHLEDDVIVGAGAAVLGGVRVGAGARIGANAVVLHDVPPGAVVGGVPARVVSSKTSR
jgi:serine O-acetyltransferase